MKLKLIVTAVLLAFVAVSVIFFVVKETRRASPAGGGREESPWRAPQAPAANTGEAAFRTIQDGIIVYYFHATRRCARCIKFEEYTKEAITAGFADDLKDGTLAWRVVNMDEPENEHYVLDYSLNTKSVVLVKVKGGTLGRWKNLSRIWDLVDDRTAFIAYIRSEVTDFRKGR